MQFFLQYLRQNAGGLINIPRGPCQAANGKNASDNVTDRNWPIGNGTDGTGSERGTYSGDRPCKKFHDQGTALADEQELKCRADCRARLGKMQLLTSADKG